MAVRHQRNLVRDHFQHKVHETLHGGVALNVEFRLDGGADLPDIGVPYVAFVRAWMHRNAFCAEFLTADGGQRNVRNGATARIADGGNFIDIYT